MIRRAYVLRSSCRGSVCRLSSCGIWSGGVSGCSCRRVIRGGKVRSCTGLTDLTRASDLASNPASGAVVGGGRLGTYFMVLNETDIVCHLTSPFLLDLTGYSRMAYIIASGDWLIIEVGRQQNNNMSHAVISFYHAFLPAFPSGFSCRRIVYWPHSGLFVY